MARPGQLRLARLRRGLLVSWHESARALGLRGSRTLAAERRRLLAGRSSVPVAGPVIVERAGSPGRLGQLRCWRVLVAPAPAEPAVTAVTPTV